MGDKQHGLIMKGRCQRCKECKHSIPNLTHGFNVPLRVRRVEFVLSPDLGILSVILLIQIAKESLLQG